MQKLKLHEKPDKAVRRIRVIYIMMLFLVLFGCKGNETEINKTQNYYDVDSINSDYLLSFSVDNDSSGGTSYGYRNLHGEIVIPLGKYQQCFTDTFKNFAFVYDDMLTNSKVIAIDRNEKKLFDAYMFDNGPDWLEEGLFRIIRNGKIGYADENGFIVIEPIFECADQFEDGTARVALNCNLVKSENDPEHTSMESDSWFYIDQKGIKVK
ncbi:hypothetical protein ASZ90_004892 [hydrocarbon metagenome]|uniref:WG repeat-containing protein n=1 Tax=hydrocarbon metagenome TaxID=938273 RepID=A0A0W8FWK4_9ZZZZ